MILSVLVAIFSLYYLGDTASLLVQDHELDVPKAVAWPRVHFSMCARNATSQSGKATKYASVLKWYDYNRKSLRQQCLIAGQEKSWNVLWIKDDYFMFDSTDCVIGKSPLGMVTPDWFRNTDYIGKEFVNGVESHKWGLAGFYYMTPLNELARPIRVEGPFGNIGYFLRDDYVVFEERSSIPAENFEIPKHCNNAASVSYGDPRIMCLEDI